MSTTRPELTLFPPATPASRPATPGSAEARQMTAGSGRKCFGFLHSAGPAGFLVRTLLDTSRWASKVCWLTWKPKVLRSGRLYFQLAPSTPRTGATGFGLLPTPTTDSQYSRRRPYAQGGMPLALAVKLLPTPIANDAANPAAYSSRLRKAKAPGLAAEITNRLQPDAPEAAWDGYLLNPRFVLEMMGFPATWCDLTETEMQQVRQQIRATGKKTRAIGPATPSKPLATP